jgi:hypothetical protein
VSVSLKIAAGRTIWIADAHRGDGKRFVVRADEKLTAFVELESAICAASFALLRNLARNHGILVVGVHGTQPMVTIGNDHLSVARIPYQQEWRQRLPRFYFLSVHFNVKIAHT